MGREGITAAAATCALLVLAGCARPAWTDPANSRDRRDLPAAPQTRRPAPILAEPLPPAPAWARGLIGRPLRSVFRRNGVCLGQTERVERLYTGRPAGLAVRGWGWDVASGRPVARVVLVDDDLRIVGAGEGGYPRPKLPRLAPAVTDPRAGWSARTGTASGTLRVYGVVAQGAQVCPLGQVEL